MRILSLSLALLPLSFGAVRLGQARQDRLVQVEVETVRRRSVDLTILSPSSNDLTCPSCIPSPSRLKDKLHVNMLKTYDIQAGHNADKYTKPPQFTKSLREI